MSAIEASDDEEEHHPLRHVTPDFGDTEPGVSPCPRGVDGDAALPGVFWSFRTRRRKSVGRPKHLLWALHFIKVYPKQSPGCSTVGASAGAIDPTTRRKWVWAFIDALASLVNVTVSLTCSVGTGAGVMYC